MTIKMGNKTNVTHFKVWCQSTKHFTAYTNNSQTKTSVNFQTFTDSL